MWYVIDYKMFRAEIRVINTLPILRSIRYSKLRVDKQINLQR